MVAVMDENVDAGREMIYLEFEWILGRRGRWA